MTDALDALRAAIEVASADRAVMVVALDGRSGAGKSTLAARLAEVVDAAVIEGDDFYAGGTEAAWRAMTPAERAAHCIDWRRQRPVLEALRAGRPASWYPFDWEAFDGRLVSEAVAADPTPVVVLEGVYSARPELADLVDLRVLLDPADDVRRRQLRERDGDADADDWESLWESAEEHHFVVVTPPTWFDLVLDPTSG
ncbi:MAG: hypothetical protein AAGA17_21715 [Actinomycetota bacterium]